LGVSLAFAAVGLEEAELAEGAGEEGGEAVFGGEGGRQVGGGVGRKLLEGGGGAGGLVGEEVFEGRARGEVGDEGGVEGLGVGERCE
jgi:hypothetical protein